MQLKLKNSRGLRLLPEWLILTQEKFSWPQTDSKLTSSWPRHHYNNIAVAVFYQTSTGWNCCSSSTNLIFRSVGSHITVYEQTVWPLHMCEVNRLKQVCLECGSLVLV
mgnify:CR=1 FL=1